MGGGTFAIVDHEVAVIVDNRSVRRLIRLNPALLSDYAESSAYYLAPYYYVLWLEIVIYQRRTGLWPIRDMSSQRKGRKERHLRVQSQGDLSSFLVIHLYCRSPPVCLHTKGSTWPSQYPSTLVVSVHSAEDKTRSEMTDPNEAQIGTLFFFVFFPYSNVLDLIH